tara:strand:+ start:395 stop:919 length:525 start_codon:yes stop_codon:yes gene_type:complete
MSKHNQSSNGRFPNFSNLLCFNKGFFESQSYRELTKSELEIFIYIRACLKYANTGKKRKVKWEASNNGDIEISMEKMRKKISISKQTCSKGVHKLIKVGFIKLTRLGRNKTCHMYKVLYDVVPQSEERWRKYPEQDWEHECPKTPNTLIGVKTRFKSHPNKVDCISDKQTSKVD